MIMEVTELFILCSNAPNVGYNYYSSNLVNSVM